MKDIEISLDDKILHPFVEFNGKVTVNFPGRFDGIVINTQILNSNNLIIYKSQNGKKISKQVSRLFISKDNMPQNTAKFSASIEFEPKETHEVKFRASIIEQHKEIENDVIFVKFCS